MTSLAAIHRQLIPAGWDVHRLALAVIAGVLVIVMGTIMLRLVGHVLRVLVWIVALGVAVYVVYRHAPVAIDRHQLEQLLSVARQLIGG